jgi:hypothetical protein
VKPKDDAAPARIQPLNVEEALKYTPLSSVVPFSPGKCPFAAMSLGTGYFVARC